jgi:hypothetical protein
MKMSEWTMKLDKQVKGKNLKLDLELDLYYMHDDGFYSCKLVIEEITVVKLTVFSKRLNQFVTPSERLLKVLKTNLENEPQPEIEFDLNDNWEPDERAYDDCFRGAEAQGYFAEQQYQAQRMK